MHFNVWGWIQAGKVKGKTHDLNHDLTFSAHTSHSKRSVFRVLDIYNFDICNMYVHHFKAGLLTKIADVY